MLGFPIRTSPDQRLVGDSPRLNAASHVLHRLLMPRHPPCALKNLATKMLASTMQISNNKQRPCQTHHQTLGQNRIDVMEGRSRKRGTTALVLHRRERQAGLKAATRRRQPQSGPFPQDPTVCPNPPEPPEIVFPLPFPEGSRRYQRPERTPVIRLASAPLMSVSRREHSPLTAT